MFFFSFSRSDLICSNFERMKIFSWRWLLVKSPGTFVSFLTGVLILEIVLSTRDSSFQKQYPKFGTL